MVTWNCIRFYLIRVTPLLVVRGGSVAGKPPTPPNRGRPSSACRERTADSSPADRHRRGRWSCGIVPLYAVLLFTSDRRAVHVRFRANSKNSASVRSETEPDRVSLLLNVYSFRPNRPEILKQSQIFFFFF